MPEPQKLQPKPQTDATPKKVKEVIIVIDDPDTGRAHVEIPGAVPAQVTPLKPQQEVPMEQAASFKSPLLGSKKASKTADLNRTLQCDSCGQNFPQRDAQLSDAPGNAKCPSCGGSDVYFAEDEPPTKTADASPASPNSGKQFPGIMIKDAENGNLVFVDETEGEYTQNGKITNDSGDTMIKQGPALVASSIHGVTFGSSVAELVRDFHSDEATPEYIQAVEQKLNETGHVMLSEECSLIKIKPEDWAGLKILNSESELPAVDFGATVEGGKTSAMEMTGSASTLVFADSKVTCGLLEYHSEGGETAEELSHAFTDGLEAVGSMDHREFAGLCLHLVQQTGGKLLLNGKPLAATEMDQTSGEPLSDGDIVEYDGQKVPFGEIHGSLGF
jgi:predicted  nucleic acid-binding Zn-ribbon protein